MALPAAMHRKDCECYQCCPRPRGAKAVGWTMEEYKDAVIGEAVRKAKPRYRYDWEWWGWRRTDGNTDEFWVGVMDGGMTEVSYADWKRWDNIA